MRIWLLLLLVPSAAAHGALAINEFDTYAISDFEGHEDSFAWEGWEIWDVYAGDGYHPDIGHGVFFKVNVAGAGDLRPTESEVWELVFTFNVAGEALERRIAHDGTDVTTDFEVLEHQIADGNVFQVHAWAPVAEWRDATISDLVVVSLVDGAGRDIAPGGIYDPATGQEVPVNAPPTPVFPEVGEGRIVDQVPLTGSGKYLDVDIDPQADDVYIFTVTNPLAEQGQHFMFRADAAPGWTLDGAPNAESLDGGSMTEFVLRFTPADNGTIAPLRFDLMTDIGGLQTYYAYLNGESVMLTQDPAAAMTAVIEPPTAEAPGLPLALVLAAILLVRRR